MSLKNDITKKQDELYRLIDGGHTEHWDDIHVLEHVTSIPIDGNEDALSRIKDLERVLGKEVTFAEFDEMLIHYEIIDTKRVRRRVEDYFRKKATEETILKQARYLGVPRY